MLQIFFFFFFFFFFCVFQVVVSRRAAHQNHFVRKTAKTQDPANSRWVWISPPEVLCYRYITKYCSLEHSCYLVMHSAEYLCRLHRYAKGARGPRQWKSTLLEVNFLYKFWIFLRARKRTLRREGLARILMECSDRWHQHPNIISQLPKTLLGYNSRLCLFCCLSVTRPKA